MAPAVCAGHPVPLDVGTRGVDVADVEQHGPTRVAGRALADDLHVALAAEPPDDEHRDPRALQPAGRLRPRVLLAGHVQG
ncbi:hypothetical protein [Streptomyces brasiliensis]|uniref:Uncharacterized protein n=1 Tax=Streptomyces brasiliensis TaxID=1954 RepID=A0A917KT61_9ACTN|nr:hypothetical protein [Streptomyces brasiliensis]GGJ28716.1 hypothetical protein GCM10010121_045050 [Streptomyces brasiliensis]